MKIDTTRRMQEFALPKGNQHDFMQVYNCSPVIEGYATVAFFHGARASIDVVPEFARYQTTFYVCAFYTNVPLDLVEEYLNERA